MILKFDRNRLKAIEADLARLDATPLATVIKVDLVAEKLARGGYTASARVLPPCDTEA